MREPIDQPLLAPIASGGGVVAGISAALIAAYQIADCHVYKNKPGQCDQVVVVGVPAVIAGAGALFGTLGGLWTFNNRLREPEPRQRRRDPRGRFTSD